MLVAILPICGFSSCSLGKGSQAEGIQAVAGTLEGPLSADSASPQVLEVMAHAERFHQYEIMSDSACSISVEAIAEADTTQTCGYGIVVVKGATSTTFPNLSNERAPSAVYDASKNVLWLTCCAMWGTGVQVDRLYQIRFDENDKAYIANTVEPYDLQQQLCLRLGYTIDAQDISLWDGTRKIVTVTNTVADMGGFDDEKPVWIGEQIQFDLTEPSPRLLLTPGVKFITGLVLTYDDMPTLTAPLTIADDGTVSIGDIDVIK